MNFVDENINLRIDDDSIACKYDFNSIQSTEWQVNLFDDKIIYCEGDKETTYLINDIKELEFEIEARDARRYPHNSDLAIAYVVLKNDPEPLELFSLIAWQESFALSSKTKSYELCDTILKSISTKYSIPYSYKISIETKKKMEQIGIGIPVFNYNINTNVVNNTSWLRSICI